jgi:branched-chain amino acid transport system substrate-binding protein
MKQVMGLLAASLAVLGAGCNIPIDNQEWSCSNKSDCGAGWQCEARRCVPAYSNQNGVYDDRLVFGMTAVLTDDVESLAVIGRQALSGIEAYFQYINRTGGIHGRKLELDEVNDSYDPARTVQNFEKFVGADGSQRDVFLVCNTLGTPTSVAAAEVALREQVILWSPGSGLGLLEPDPPNRYVFNFRPRFADEAEQVAQYLLTVIDPNTPEQNLALLAQGSDDQGTLDLPGADTVEGVARALGVPRDEVPYATYEFNTTDVREPVRRLLKWMASEDRVVTNEKRYIGLVLGAVFDAGAAFIRTTLNQLSAARAGATLDAPFDSAFDEDELARLATVELRMGAYSGIAATALSATLKSFGTYQWAGGPDRRYGAGLVISQTVPSVSASGSSGVLEYLRDLKALDPEIPPGEFSLETYLNMRLLGEALEAHGPDLTTESLIETLEGFRADLGVGAELGFSIGSHQAAQRVWGIRLDDELEVEPLGLLLPE